MPYPTFLIIGANKGGTTSLYRYLSAHPDVYMSPVKEPSYFAKLGQDGADPTDPAQRRTTAKVTWTEAEYLALFDGVRDEHAIGEASTAYLANSNAAGRIAETIPDVKLLAVLRQPVQRAFSAYAMHVSWGFEHLDFADAVAAELAGDRPDGLRRHYIRTGYYGRQLERYFARFPPEQMQFHLYEDLSADPTALVRSVLEFIGVDPAWTPDTASRYNVTPKPSRLDRIPRPLRHLAGRLLPVRARQRIRNRTARVLELPDATRRQLLELYRDDIRLTQKLIERDLSSWLEE